MAVNCNFGITADILKDCAAPPTAGVEEVMYVWNRKDMEGYTKDPTNKNLITAITMKPGTKAYKVEGFKKEVDAGFDLVTSDTNIDKFMQYVKFENWQIDAASVKELDGLSDLVCMPVRKNKGLAGNGAFQIYGLETGLYKSSDTMRANSESGKRIIELTNQAEEESTVSYHVFYDTSLSATQTAADALLVTAV